MGLFFCSATFFCSQAPNFKLDASADSLVLENDESLRYYRKIYSQYSSNDFLVLTYRPNKDLFSEDSLTDLTKLTKNINALDYVESVVSILNVPLLFSPKVSISDLSKNIRTLETPGLDVDLAKNEFLNNPIYNKQLLSEDGKTTAILVNLPVDLELRTLLNKRSDLRSKKHLKTITPDQLIELKTVSDTYRIKLTQLTETQNKNVEKIRDIMDQHRQNAQMYLGGVPMIIADMISFIGNDIIVFGLGVLVFLIVTLTIIFRKLRWVILPMICCFAAALTMLGYLGSMDWRVTVISSNFISLMLIITMSLTIHLIVRYRELCLEMPEADQFTLISETVRLKFSPCLYTTLTTIVAFISLLVSSIRPVMDFGLMMTIGLIVSFLLTFLIFPATAMLIKRDHIKSSKEDASPFTMFFAQFTNNHGTLIIVITILVTIASFAGISKLVVENRFIDYFRESTEIYQGMKVIDQELGGTTPLDVIINFKDDSLSSQLTNDDSLLLDDEDEDALLLDDETDSLTAEDDFSGDEYWFTSYKMEQISKVHDYLDSLSETGKVLSIATMIKIATSLNDEIVLDDYELSIMYKKIPQSIKKIMVDPYISVANNQARLTMRIMESDKSLSRDLLLKKIKAFLVEEMGFSEDQINFTNMVVLYNNMLQSLFQSQIMTIGVVSLGIMIMFMILFRSLPVALISITPNLLPAAMVLGTMGWLGIPLDMMTITIAAITIGIAVDDTIHYVHRFRKEFHKDFNYINAMNRSHASIGKAMYYTSLTIVIGFSILILSNFIPTIYFGIFTGFAMLAALLAALTLLPQLLIIFKPFGPERP